MSRLAEMQARFQQRQMQEKEEKLLRLYETQQQRAFEKVSRGSSGGSVSGATSPVALGASLGATGAGRVRQLFEERRQKAGIDRSYPLEPLKQTTRLNGHAPAARVSSLDRSLKNPISRTVKTTVQRTVSQSTNGKPLKSRSIQQASKTSYSNGKLIEESYEDDSVQIMKQQQRELEMMMNNHNLNDSLINEEMPDEMGDDVEETDGLAPSPNENDNYIQRESNGNFSPTSNMLTTKKTPAKIVSPRTISPKSSAEEKKRPPVMKSTAAPRPAQPRQTSNSVRTATPKSTPKSALSNDNLSPCKFCQRRFQSDRLGKHEEICAKTLKKKRKTYDAVKHRVQGTEVEGYAKKGPKGTSVKVSKPPQMPKTDWRRQHEEFIATIRAAKMAQAHVAAGGKLTDLPPPPPSLNPDYVQCPHCGRRFNEAAAARHIPKCATMMHNKPNRNQPAKKKF